MIRRPPFMLKDRISNWQRGASCLHGRCGGDLRNKAAGMSASAAWPQTATPSSPTPSELAFDRGHLHPVARLTVAARWPPPSLQQGTIRPRTLRITAPIVEHGTTGPVNQLYDVLVAVCAETAVCDSTARPPVESLAPGASESADPRRHPSTTRLLLLGGQFRRSAGESTRSHRSGDGRRRAVARPHRRCADWDRDR